MNILYNKKKKNSYIAFFFIGLCILIISIVVLTGVFEEHFPGLNPRSPIHNKLIEIYIAEQLWKEIDYDKNGKHDYWTYDVWCIYVIPFGLNPGDTPITPDILYADACAADNKTFESFTNNKPNYNVTYTPRAYNEYLIRAMVYDENGIKYNQNEVGTAKIPACNDNKFAFVWFPFKYGKYSRYTMIVNETGFIYKADCGSDAEKMVLKWPGKDPTKVVSPGGEYWEKVEEIEYR